MELEVIISLYDAGETDVRTLKCACDRAYDALNQLDLNEELSDVDPGKKCA